MESKKTPLYELHKELGAKLVDFAGFAMPIKYTSEVEEHMAVRSTCGLFDVSHMGELSFSGEGAIDALQKITTNDVNLLNDGECQYTLMCNENGGIVDDCIVYRLSQDKYLLCVNASNTLKAYKWAAGKVGKEVKVCDVSSSYAQLALQGPLSDRILTRVSGVDTLSIKSFHFIEASLFGFKAIISRTGYTGEPGFEIYIEPDGAVKLWKELLLAGADDGVIPCGLACRDTLRLEMGYSLYGNDLNDETTPIEAKLKRFVSFNKKFIGDDVLKAQVESGTDRTLIAFEVVGTGIPRAHYSVLKDGKNVGEVSSGTYSPSLKKGIAIGYIDSDLKAVGTLLDVEIRGKAVGVRVVKLPFYRHEAPPVKAASS